MSKNVKLDDKVKLLTFTSLFLKIAPSEINLNNGKTYYICFLNTFPDSLKKDLDSYYFLKVKVIDKKSLHFKSSKGLKLDIKIKFSEYGKTWFILEKDTSNIKDLICNKERPLESLINFSFKPDQIINLPFEVYIPILNS